LGDCGDRGPAAVRSPVHSEGWPQARGWTVCAAARSGKNPDVIRKRVVVSGRVQGVFFRDSCQQAAQQHEIAGWVANRGDGSVEAVFEGDDDAVREMVEWVRRGPSQADVTGVDVTDERPEGLGDFSVR
jgi:acylphosphatase